MPFPTSFSGRSSKPRYAMTVQIELAYSTPDIMAIDCGKMYTHSVRAVATPESITSCLTSVLCACNRQSYIPVTMDRKPSRTRALGIPRIKVGYLGGRGIQKSRVSGLLRCPETGHHAC